MNKDKSLAEEMEELLLQAFAPTSLIITNDSHRHKGHSGDNNSGESHFSLEIIATAFSGKSRLERQRMVYQALGDIAGVRVHALAIKASPPA